MSLSSALTGFGFADTGKQVAMTPQTKFRMASHSKLFTATAIMQLREQGKLRLVVQDDGDTEADHGEQEHVEVGALVTGEVRPGLAAFVPESVARGAALLAAETEYRTADFADDAD